MLRRRPQGRCRRDAPPWLRRAHPRRRVCARAPRSRWSHRCAPGRRRRRPSVRAEHRARRDRGRCRPRPRRRPARRRAARSSWRRLGRRDRRVAPTHDDLIRAAQVCLGYRAQRRLGRSADHRCARERGNALRTCPAVPRRTTESRIGTAVTRRWRKFTVSSAIASASNSSATTSIGRPARAASSSAGVSSRTPATGASTSSTSASSSTASHRSGSVTIAGVSSPRSSGISWLTARSLVTVLLASKRI